MNQLTNKMKLSSLLLLVVMATSCTKTFDEKTVLNSDFSGSSVVQVFLTTVGASRNYVHVDGKLVTGSLLNTTFSATSGYTASLFPAAGVGHNVPSGLRSFLLRDTLSTTTQPQLNFAQNLQAGAYYTTFAYDTITAVKQKTVQNNIVVPADNSCRIRFANFAYNGNAITPAVDIISLGKNEIVATNVRYTDVTEFIVHPSQLAGEGFQVRESGTSNILATTTSTSLVPKRSYTIVYRGSHRATSGSSTRAVSVFVNY
ncbi:MAG: DUF4397 domain-containing protein [Sphingomonadales bacterium]|nr:DUF4397 domain-containing protein [Sphingomonadales bacterium]